MKTYLRLIPAADTDDLLCLIPAARLLARNSRTAFPCSCSILIRTASGVSARASKENPMTENNDRLSRFKLPHFYQGLVLPTIDCMRALMSFATVSRQSAFQNEGLCPQARRLSPHRQTTFVFDTRRWSTVLGDDHERLLVAPKPDATI